VEETIYKGARGGEHPESPELFDWQKELLDQRLKDAAEHPEDWVSWDEARQRLERQIHGPARASMPGLRFDRKAG
jgi:hypothetical protein